jgi:hypothetical protein
VGDNDVDKKRVQLLLWPKIASTVLLLVVICCATLSLLTPRGRITINHALWKLAKPEEYYMEVRELSGGLWRWRVHVQDDNLLSAQLLESETSGFAEKESWLESNSLTIEQIFTAASRFCADRGFTKCRLEFDSQFHYPKQVESYELMIIEVENFISCDKDSRKCPRQ